MILFLLHKYIHIIMILYFIINVIKIAKHHNMYFKLDLKFIII